MRCRKRASLSNDSQRSIEVRYSILAIQVNNLVAFGRSQSENGGSTLHGVVTMASKQKHKRPIPGWREHQPSARAVGTLPSLDDAQGWSNEQLAELDIGAVNLLCASGLPGAGELNISELTAWLDDAADKVYIATGENYDKLLDAPGAFGNSQTRFCMQYLVTVLQRHCGVHYNPKWKGLTPDTAIRAASERTPATCSSTRSSMASAARAARFRSCTLR